MPSDLEQYLIRMDEGTLSDDELKALTRLLKEDAEARKIYLEHQKISESICRTLAPVQGVRFDSRWRVAPGGARRYWAVPLSMAAAVLVAVGAWWITTVGSKIEGSVVETGKGQTIALRFEGEETLVEMAENTKLRVVGASIVPGTATNGVPVESGLAKVIQLETGSIRALVAEQTGGKSFVVKTSQVEAKVIGTAFDVVTAKRSSALDVFSGGVEVTRLSDGRKLEVGRGKRVVVGEGIEFALRTSVYYPGGEYADGRTIFEDNLMGDLQNWDVLYSAVGEPLRQATDAERARIVRKPLPDEIWPTKGGRGTVLLANNGETVGLRLKKALPVTPLAVEFVRQADQSSETGMSFGNEKERRSIRKFPPFHYMEHEGESQIRREVIPIAATGDAQVVEDRRFYLGWPWWWDRVTLDRRGGMYLTITMTHGWHGRALFSDVVVREMKKIEKSE